MTASRRPLDWIDGLFAVLLFGCAVWVRMRVLAVAQITPDCMGPYLGAWEMLTTGDWVGPSKFPESGPGLYWSYVPFLLGADGLEAALTRRFVLQACHGPAIYLALRATLTAHWAGIGPSPGRLGPAIAGCALAFSHGPLASLLSGAEGFVSPDHGVVITVAALLVLLADRPWALVVGWAALPIAMMTHGMAAAYGPGLLFLAALVWRRGHRRIAIGSLVAGAVGYAPRAAQLVRKVLDEGFEGASQLAAYNSEGDRFWAELVHRTSDHLLHRDGLPWGPLWGLTPLLILAAVWVAPRISPSSDLPRRVRDVCAWALLTLAGIVTVAWMIRYMQGYHWRVVYPAGAAAIGVGLDVLLRRIPRPAQAGAAAVVLAAGCSLGLERWPAPDPASTDLTLVGAFVDALEESGAEALWVERGGIGWEPWGYAPALYLESRLRGDRREHDLDGSLFLLFTAGLEAAAAIDATFGWMGQAPPLSTAPGTTLVARGRPWNGPVVYLVRLDDRAASLAWHRQVLLLRGGEPVMMKAEAGEYLPALGQPFDYADVDAWFPSGLER